MQELLSVFSNPFPPFFSWYFWADVCSICLFILLLFLIIRRQSVSILQNNIVYNKGFFKFRAEVYTNYEKNFFV